MLHTSGLKPSCTRYPRKAGINPQRDGEASYSGNHSVSYKCEVSRVDSAPLVKDFSPFTKIAIGFIFLRPPTEPLNVKVERFFYYVVRRCISIRGARDPFLCV